MSRTVSIPRSVIRGGAAVAGHRMRAVAAPSALLVLLALVFAGAVHAQATAAPDTGAVATPVPAREAAAVSAPARPAQPRVAVGDTTRGLLALQRGGTQASATPRPIDAPVAALSYQRYLESFKHPIPESASERSDARNATPEAR